MFTNVHSLHYTSVSLTMGSINNGYDGLCNLKTQSYINNVPVTGYRIRQNIRGGKLSRFINNVHYVGKTFAVCNLKASARLCNADVRVCAKVCTRASLSKTV